MLEQKTATTTPKMDLRQSLFLQEFLSLAQAAKGDVAKQSPVPLSREKLQKLLTAVFGDAVWVLFPDAASPSPLAANPQAAYRNALSYIKQIRGYQVKGETTPPPSLLEAKPLSKPLVMVLPAPEASETWIACVVLPQDYQPPFGQPTKNTQSEVLFYLDARVGQASHEMPPHFWPLYRKRLGKYTIVIG